MKANVRLWLATGGISIALFILCFIGTFELAPSLIIAAMFGLPCAVAMLTFNSPARVGVCIGSVSVVFSTLCFLIMPVFTASVVLAIFFSIPGGATALALKARRTALVTFAFAPVPLLGFLLMEHASRLVGSGYIAFLALGMAIFIAAWAIFDYSKARKPLVSAGA